MTTYLNYLISAIICFVIDIALFNIFLSLLPIMPYYLIIAALLARFASSLVNYYLNKYFVFKYEKKGFKAIFKYFILVIINITISSILVLCIYNILNINVTIIKIIIDILIFISNYLIQKFWIFNK